MPLIVLAQYEAQDKAARERQTHRDRQTKKKDIRVHGDPLSSPMGSLLPAQRHRRAAHSLSEMFLAKPGHRKLLPYLVFGAAVEAVVAAAAEGPSAPSPKPTLACGIALALALALSLAVVVVAVQ